jgi:Lon protease-like protein
MEQVADQDTKLPIVVIDTMLPRQVLKIEANEDSFTRLVKTQLEKENPVFGMVGLATLSTGQTLPLQNGVEVEIVGMPKVVEGTPLGLRVELRAGRRFRITGELDTAKEGWTQARVRFLDSKQEEEAEEKGAEPIALARAMSLAREFTAPNVNMKDNASLVDRWIELARQKERNPGQIDQLLKDLGKIPPVTEPSERAFWVGALINPLPGMGVAMEIRPQLLMARTAEERVGTAIAGILASIRHMDGTKTLF